MRAQTGIFTTAWTRFTLAVRWSAAAAIEENRASTFVFGRCGKRATRPYYKTEICLKLYGSELMIFRYSASLNAFKVWVVIFPSELTDSMNFAQTSSLGNSAMITAS